MIQESFPCVLFHKYNEFIFVLGYSSTPDILVHILDALSKSKTKFASKTFFFRFFGYFIVVWSNPRIWEDALLRKKGEKRERRNRIRERRRGGGESRRRKGHTAQEMQLLLLFFQTEERQQRMGPKMGISRLPPTTLSTHFPLFWRGWKKVAGCNFDFPHR